MKSMLSCENAISAVVSAVIILGILVSVMTLVHVQYIPEWKTAAEQSHMDDVFYDMAEMKNEVDILSAYARTEPSMDLSIGVPVKMGGGSLPVFNPGKSSGRLAINDETLNMSIIASTPGPNYNSGTFLLDLGAVTYLSDNNYFVDQKMVFENGALIVSQNEYALLRLAPRMDIVRSDNASKITMIINAIDINGPARSISSNSVEEVHFSTNGSDSLYWEGVLFNDVTMILETSYPGSWESFFESLANDADLDPAEYSVSSNDTAVVLYLEGDSGGDIRLNVTKTLFDARLNLLS